MKKTGFILLFVVTLFVFAQSRTQAKADSTPTNPTNEELLEEIQALKARISELERKLAAQIKPTIKASKKAEVQGSGRPTEWIRCTPGEGFVIEPLDLKCIPFATLVLQGTPNANNPGDAGESQLDGSYKIDIDFEKNFWDWGYAFCEFEIGDGDSAESYLDVFSNVDQNLSDTDSRIEVTKVWYDQYLFNKQLVIGVGKWDATDWMDENNFAGCDNTQFIGRCFKRSPVIEWPGENTLGVRAKICFEPIDFLDFSLGYFDSDADYRRIFEHGFYSFQINARPAAIMKWDPEKWEGNYRFYAWINSRNHQKLVDEGEDPSDKTNERNFGFGFSCDQKVTDVFGVFGRFGWQRPDIVMADDGPTLEWFWSGGVRATGKYWMREGDIIAFGIGQIFPSAKYGKAGNPDGAEGHIEMYYSFKVNDYIYITPDFQIIWNPNGVIKPSEGDDDTIFVYGVRAYLGF